MTKPPRTKLVLGARSWTFASDCVDAALTQQGGHLGPVRFHTARGIVEPFAVAPWGTEKINLDLAPVLQKLRGDFFCAPFGGNERTWRGKKYPVHGATASNPWKFVSYRKTKKSTEFTASLRDRISSGEVTKTIELRSGETNVYCRHQLKKFSGAMSVGHHAMLSFPNEAGPGQILLSPWHQGRVAPRQFETPERGGYSSLKTDAAFSRLDRVPLVGAERSFADLTCYPAREGFEDLVMVSSRRPAQLAWTTVTFSKPGWLWFAIKDPRTLASTILWHSNGGRHYPPWNGRHRGVLGLEEVTSYFHYGLADSTEPNPLSKVGIPTSLPCRPDRVLTVNYITGVVALPRGFDRLQSVRLEKTCLIAKAKSGAVTRHPVDLSFFNSPP